MNFKPIVTNILRKQKEAKKAKKAGKDPYLIHNQDLGIRMVNLKGNIQNEHLRGKVEKGPSQQSLKFEIPKHLEHVVTVFFKFK